MITKERLEQLIKEEATIWHDDFGKIKLNKNTCKICDVQGWTRIHIYWALCIEYKYNNEKYHHDINIDELEEDVETAEWHNEMDCRRWEELEFPTWKEVTKFPDTRMFCEFYVDEGDNVYKYTLDKDISKDEIIIIQYDILEDSGDVIWSEKFNKENYKKACLKCKELFLGGYICQSE